MLKTHPTHTPPTARRLALALIAVLATACSPGSDGQPPLEADAATDAAPADTDASPADAAAAPNTLTDAERAAGWRLLFDGETTDGWRGYNRDAFPDTGWAVIDGMLVVGATSTDPDVAVGGRHRHHRVLHRLRPQVRVHALGGGEQRRPLPRDRRAGRRDLAQRPRVPGPRRHRVHRDGHDGHEHPPSPATTTTCTRPARRRSTARASGTRPASASSTTTSSTGSMARRRWNTCSARRAGRRSSRRASSRRSRGTARAASGPIGLQDHGRNVFYRSIRILPLEPVSLFNGDDLDGWQVHGTELWYVEDGDLVCESGARRAVRLSHHRAHLPRLRPHPRLQAGGRRQQRRLLPLQRRGHDRERLAGRGRAAGALQRAGSTSRTDAAGWCSPTRRWTGRCGWATGTPCGCARWATA